MQELEEMTDQEFKDKLWKAAIALRGSVDAAQYKYPVLGLVFLKYASDMFESQEDVIRQQLADSKSDFYFEDEDLREEALIVFLKDKTFYESDNVFWVPEKSHFSHLLTLAANANFPQILDKAIKALEDENTSLKGILYRDFGSLELEGGKLGDLMNIIAGIKFDSEQHKNRDVFGEVYEYFLGKFARQEGANAGEFYTPKSLVKLLVEILTPFKGKIYDPACGSGGMFVQSVKFKDAHSKRADKKGDLSIYGQEKMSTTRKLCKMNLAVHGMEGDIGKSFGSTFTNDQHSTLRADYVIANPPFNISDWDGDKLKKDPRWTYGIPPASNANYAWLQHMLSRLSKSGRAGIILADGSLSIENGGQGKIRKAMILDDVIECMIVLPSGLFSNFTGPACIWFLSKDKKSGKNGKKDRTGKVLFIDARNSAEEEISRKQIGFTNDNLMDISQIYHRWRETDFSDEGKYSNVKGLCYSASLKEIEKHDFVLTPGRYIEVAKVENNDISFEANMAELTQTLFQQMKKRKVLDEIIKHNLGVLGYGS